MPLKPREKSSLGIYHVMFRGINKQNIFFCEDDFVRMQTILRDAPFKKRPDGSVSSESQCTIYAYCILNNHVHLLIKEGAQTVSQIIKSIELKYSKYYNNKYDRVGHLFQGRFPSEAVNDEVYFHTLLRYIHRNSVKAMESNTPEEYPYSSWNEYVNHPSNIVRVLRNEDIEFVLDKFPLQELIEWVNTDKDDECLDMNSFRNIITDKESFEILQDVSGIENPEEFRQLDAPTQIYYLLQAIDHGINFRQAARLGSVTRYQLEKAFQRKSWRNSTTVSDTVAEEKLEKTEGDSVLIELNNRVRQITGLGKKTYLRLHQIVEHLFLHSDSSCMDIANILEVSNEGARKYLVILANENIVEIKGSSRATLYSIKKLEQISHSI